MDGMTAGPRYPLGRIVAGDEAAIRRAIESGIAVEACAWPVDFHQPESSPSLFLGLADGQQQFVACELHAR